jgi:hypothetical protein
MRVCYDDAESQRHIRAFSDRSGTTSARQVQPFRDDVDIVVSHPTSRRVLRRRVAFNAVRGSEMLRSHLRYSRAGRCARRW